MTADMKSEVIEFQNWLAQSIRRAWILAFTVAVPGAFLVTLWFPRSPEALIGVAILGIAIGVISDAFESAKARRVEELSQLKEAIRQTIEEMIASVNETLREGKGRRVDFTSLETEMAKLDRLVAAGEKRFAKTRIIDIKLPPEGILPQPGTQYVLVETHDDVRLVPLPEMYRSAPTSKVTVSASLTDVALFNEISVRIERLALQMNLPLAELWKHLELIASASRVVFGSAVESKPERESSSSSG